MSANNAQRRSVVAGTLALLAFALPSCAQTLAAASGGGPGVQRPVESVTPAVNARTVSCTELKASVKAAGALTVTSGPEGGDVFHARIPACEFWQRPRFSFVPANDGWCGIGYVCAGKLQG